MTFCICCNIKITQIYKYIDNNVCKKSIVFFLILYEAPPFTKLYPLLSHYIYYNTYIHKSTMSAWLHISLLSLNRYALPVGPLLLLLKCWILCIYAKTISMMFFSLIHHPIFSSIHHCHRHVFVILYLILNVIFGFTDPCFVLNFYSLVSILQ